MKAKEPYINVMSSNGQCMVLYKDKAWPSGKDQGAAMLLATKLMSCDNADLQVRDNNLYVAFKMPDGGNDFFSIKDCIVKQNIQMSDNVNHPSYYGGADNPYEAIKVIEAWGLNFHLSTCIKYLSRAGKKDPQKEIEDLKKAMWYLNREIQNREKAMANGNAQPEK